MKEAVTEVGVQEDKVTSTELTFIADNASSPALSGESADNVYIFKHTVTSFTH